MAAAQDVASSQAGAAEAAAQMAQEEDSDEESCGSMPELEPVTWSQAP